MTDRIHTTTTRRAVLAGTAALPAMSLAMPAAAETDDPAIGAVGRWIAAGEAQSDYTTPDGRDWLDDPHAVALDAAEEAAFAEVLRTPPTTAEGLALMFAAHLFEREGDCIGARFHAPESAGEDGVETTAACRSSGPRGAAGGGPRHRGRDLARQGWHRRRLRRPARAF